MPFQLRRVVADLPYRHGAVGATENEDVRNAIVKETGISMDAINIISLRKTFRGMQTVMALLPLQAAINLTSKSKFRVGLVSCRAGITEKRTRCYKYLFFLFFFKALIELGGRKPLAPCCAP